MRQRALAPLPPRCCNLLFTQLHHQYNQIQMTFMPGISKVRTVSGHSRESSCVRRTRFRRAAAQCDVPASRDFGINHNTYRLTEILLRIERLSCSSSSDQRTVKAGSSASTVACWLKWHDFARAVVVHHAAPGRSDPLAFAARHRRATIKRCASFN